MNDILRRTFNSSNNSNDRIKQLVAAIPTELVISREVQGNYKIYRTICTELQSTGIDFLESNETRPLILRRLIALLWGGKHKMETLREYD